MLSAQTTDVNVNRVGERLFRKYRRPEDYLAVPVEELERDIYATGFYRQKARSIQGSMRMLVEEHGGRVPRTIEELVRLPGVARKTANVVAAELGEAQGIVVDTHVRRLAQRLGLTREQDPVKIERDLIEPRPARALASVPAPADLAWPPRLCREAPGLRALCGGGSVSVQPLSRCQTSVWHRRAIRKNQGASETEAPSAGTYRNSESVQNRHACARFPARKDDMFLRPRGRADRWRAQ